MRESISAPWHPGSTATVRAPVANDDPAPETFANGTMLTRRSSSAFDLFDRLEQQLSQQPQSAERVPAAEVHETPEAYEVVLELPGVDKTAIEVKATECTLLISAERQDQRQLGGQPVEADHSPTSSDAPTSVEKVCGPLRMSATKLLISEKR